MAVCKCWNCGYEEDAPTIEEARRLARLHMGAIGCILVFGYTNEKYQKLIKGDSNILAVDDQGLTYDMETDREGFEIP